MAENWRDEINWPRLRRAAALHGAMWAYGAVLAPIYLFDALTGPLRTALGAIAYLGVAAMMITGFSVIRGDRPRTAEDEHSEGVIVGWKAFMVLFAFIVSVCGFIALLGALGMGSIEL